MQRTCLKCGHVNAAADGGYLEACPQCGAIYTKVERVMAQRHQQEQVQAARMASAEGADNAPPRVPRPSLSARFDHFEHSVVRKTGIGLGVWILLAAVILPFAWVFVTEEPSPARQADQAQRAARVNAMSAARVNAMGAVQKHLELRLKDPRSLDVMDWGEMIDNGDGTRSMTVRYRATNSYGAYVTSYAVFRFDASGGIVAAAQAPP